MWLNIKRLYFFNSERQTEYASIAQLAEHAAVKWREGSTVRWTKSWSVEYEETRRIAKRSKRARRLCFRPVTGSRTWPKSNKIKYASIAQLAEHAAVNRGVTGSSPVWGAKQKRSHIVRSFLFHIKLSTKLFHHSQQPHAAVICRSQNNPVNCFGVAIQWGNGSCRQHIQSHRFELLVPRSHPFVTSWHFPCQGNLCLRRQTKKIAHCAVFFVSH